MTVQTVVMADSIGSTSLHLPTSLHKVGMYWTGTPNIKWDAAEIARFTKSGQVHINQDPSSDPLIGDILDSEAGAWTIPGAVAGLQKRKAARKSLEVYISAGSLTPLANALQAAGLFPVDIWLANWSLSEAQAQALVMHQAGPYPIKAVQWASPSSNPNTILPGTNLTLLQSNADLSVADASWHPAPVPLPPPPPPTVEHGLVISVQNGVIISQNATTTDRVNWKV